MKDRLFWAGMLLAAAGFVFVIAASSGHAETGEIEVNWIANNTCIISGDGIESAVVEQECNDDFSFQIERNAVNHTIYEPFNCNYSLLQEQWTNFSLRNFSDNISLICNENLSLERQNLIEGEMKSFIDERVVSRIQTLMELQAINQNLTTEVTIWRANASGSWGSINSLERENESLRGDRQIWQYAAFLLFAVVVLLSPLGASTRQKLFGVK